MNNNARDNLGIGDSEPKKEPFSGLMARKQKQANEEDIRGNEPEDVKMKKTKTKVAWLKENDDTKRKTQHDMEEILNLLSEFTNSPSNENATTKEQSVSTEEGGVSDMESLSEQIEEIQADKVEWHVSKLNNVEEEKETKRKEEKIPITNVLDELDLLINEAQLTNSHDLETEKDAQEKSGLKNTQALSFDPLAGPPYRCAGCNKIIDEEFCKTEASIWHPEHFKCLICNKSLVDDVFYELNYELYCEVDYQLQYLHKCKVCQEYIYEDMVTVSGKYYHTEHFCCSNCNTSLADKDYFQKDAKSYCKKCYSKSYASKCKACGKSVMDDFINSMGSVWHSKCFHCKKCDKPLKGEIFHFYEDKAYCEQHYHEIRGTICFMCKKPITGSFVTACDRKFHPEHLICTYCKKKLSGMIYKEYKEKPYCMQCCANLIG